MAIHGFSERWEILKNASNDRVFYPCGHTIAREVFERDYTGLEKDYRCWHCNKDVSIIRNLSNDPLIKALNSSDINFEKIQDFVLDGNSEALTDAMLLLPCAHKVNNKVKEKLSSCPVCHKDVVLMYPDVYTRFAAQLFLEITALPQSQDFRE